MVGKTNVAGARLRSVIAVTYPSGSLCTCSNGTKTLKARDTSGRALFNVPAGEWTVTATDGDKTKSQTVSITAEGQFESVTLAYIYYLQQGASIVVQPETTNASPEIVNDTVKYNGTANAACFVNFGPFDLTGFKTIVFDVLAGFTYKTPTPGFCVSNEKLSEYPSDNVTRFSGEAAYTEFTVTAGKYYLDISSISGYRYISLFWEGFGGKAHYIQTNNIWIE